MIKPALVVVASEPDDEPETEGTDGDGGGVPICENCGANEFSPQSAFGAAIMVCVICHTVQHFLTWGWVEGGE